MSPVTKKKSNLTSSGGLGYMKKNNGILGLDCVRECPFKSSLSFKARINNHHYLVANLRSSFKPFCRVIVAKVIPAIARKLGFLITKNGTRGGFGSKK